MVASRMGTQDHDPEHGHMPLDELARRAEEAFSVTASIASTLNTAPVTLTGLEKVCRSVADVSSRLEVLGERAQHAGPVEVAEFFAKAHHLGDAMAVDLETVTSILNRLHRTERDSGVDIPGSDLVIVWDEGVLKGCLTRLARARNSLEYLMGCLSHDAGIPCDVSVISKDTSPDTIDPALLNFGSRLRLAVLGSRAPSARPRASDAPEIRHLFESLAPDPTIAYSPARKYGQLLHSAIEKRNESDVLILLLQRADPNVRLPGSSQSPMHRAIQDENWAIATLLAVAGADIDEPADDGETVLIKSVKCKFPVQFVSLMCELGAATDAVDNLGSTALHHAASSAAEDEALEVLVLAGADLNRKDYRGRTPLVAAVELNRTSSVRKLIEYGTDLEARMSNGKTALHAAISLQSHAMVKLLADSGADLNQRFADHTPLTYAISTACPEITRTLVESGADINYPTRSGNVPLLAAISAGNEKMVELLLSRSAAVWAAGSCGYSPVHLAAHKNRPDIIRLLVKAGAPIDPVTDEGETPLWVAVNLGNVSSATCLIDLVANVNHVAFNDESVLAAAVRNNHTDLVSTLVKNGADAALALGTDRAETTVLHMAASNGQNDVLRAMILAGAPLETKIWPGHTPLFSAVISNQAVTTRLLLALGANPQARSLSSDTPLFHAGPATAKILLSACLLADVNHRNYQGATALHYAALRGDAAVTKMLLAKGATQFHASAVYECVDDWEKGEKYRQGTPAGVALQRGFRKVSVSIDRWRKLW